MRRILGAVVRTDVPTFNRPRETVPHAPTITLVTVVGDDSVSVAFTAPADDGGSPILSYGLYRFPGDLLVDSGAGSPLTDSGLDGAYTYQVRASNLVGLGTPSAASSTIIIGSRDATLAATLADVTVASDTLLLDDRSGGANIVLDAVQVSIAGTNAIRATMAKALAAATVESYAALPITGTMARSLASASFTSVGTLLVQATLNRTLEAVTVEATGSDAPVMLGTLAATLADATVTSAGGFSATASLAYTLASATAASTGTLALQAAISKVLDDAALTSFSKLLIGGTVASTLDEASIASIMLASPGAPTIGTAVAGNGAADFAFTPPAEDGGSPITGYVATASPGGLTGTGTSSPVTIPGLTNGVAYTGTVQAENAIGLSLPSAASNSVTPVGSVVAPGAPTIGTLSRTSSGALSIAFTAPASDGGAAITSYEAITTPDSSTASGASSPLTGFSPAPTVGTSYTVQVRAVNSVGPGPWSAASNALAPASAPSVPGIPFVTTEASGSATIYVGYPATDGGSAITHFRFTGSNGMEVTKTFAEVNAGPTIVTGLTNGVAVSFTAIAINAYGESEETLASNRVTPDTASAATGPYDSLYDPTWTPVIGKAFLPMLTQALPAKSTGRSDVSYTDQQFGTKVYRPQNAASFGAGKLRHQYSRTGAFNCDSTIYAALGGSRFYLFDLETFANIPGGASGGSVGEGSIYPQGVNEFWWHPTDPNILYFNNSTLIYYEYNISAGTVSVWRNLTTLLANAGMSTAARADTGGEGRPSDDGRWVCLWVRNGSGATLGYAIWDTETHTFSGTLLTSASANHTAMSSNGNYGIISRTSSSAFLTLAGQSLSPPVGVRAYNRTFSSFIQLGNNAGHHDPVIDADGDESYCSVANSNFGAPLASNDIYMIKIQPGAQPVKLYNRGEGSTAQRHTSGYNSPGRPGWVVISTYNAASNTGESGWCDYTIFAIKMANPTEIRRIGHTRQQWLPATGGYWFEPHATVSRDGLHVLSATGFRVTNGGAMQLADPEDLLFGLPSWFYGDAPSGGSAEKWGNNVVENGSFTVNTTGWSVGTGWARVSSGSSMEVTLANALLAQTVALQPGVTYRISYGVSAYAASGSGVRAWLGGSSAVAGALRTADGPYVEELVAVSGNNSIQFMTAGDFVGSARINDVVVVAIATVPGAPSKPVATAQDGSVRLQFSAPSSNGGSEILSYTAVRSPGGATHTETAEYLLTNPMVVPSANGVEATFTVFATNAEGDGAPSPASDPVTPAGAVVDLVTNGSFTDGSTGWSVPSGWTVTGGQAVKDTSSGGSLAQTITFVSGGTYEITYDVVSVTGGSFNCRLIGGTVSGNVIGTARSTPGTYTEQLVAGDHTQLAINSPLAGAGAIDNVVMTRVS